MDRPDIHLIGRVLAVAELGQGGIVPRTESKANNN